ncbi:YndJ family protein [Halocatena salina]|uniref:YndJ family protein n=1 Tax=Halocatena salina TaxID=2934340 RepID=A0A8U0A121_9EURY|nr:YndJ family protein [Halocatena salina]UPM41773.1 YndJ family protein [Halocatena salina]
MNNSVRSFTQSLGRRATGVSAFMGCGIWLVLVGNSLFDQLEVLFLLAPLMIVPLLLGLVGWEVRSRWYRYAVLGQPIGAVLVVVSFTVDRGIAAGVAIVPWVVVTVIVALWGLERLLSRGLEPLSALAVDAGLLYVIVGSGWLMCSRLGLQPMGFSDSIVFFTAVHFHYAGFALPILAGMTGRVVEANGGTVGRYVYSGAATTIIVGPGLIAAGITLSPLIEIVAVTALASGVIAFALVTLVVVVPERGNRIQQVALVISSVAVGVSMLFAFGYGLSQFIGRTIAGLRIDTMVMVHGHLNAVGFALLGALGWSISVPSAISHRVPPLSSLTANRRVGKEFLERNGLRGSDAPSGQMDQLSAYARPGFDPEAVHPSVRTFYEETNAYELQYDVQYHSGFRSGARLGSWVTARIEQCNLPAPGAQTKRTDSRIVDVDDVADGRTGTRAWIRTDLETENAVFVAVYATHEHKGETYMNIGLPLPWCNLSAVLWIDSVDIDTDKHGIRLSSRQRDDSGDEGIYLRTPIGPVRLPMHEDFRVWPAKSKARSDDDLVAEHRLWLFGRRFLTITYTIERTTAESPFGQRERNG